MNKNLTIKIGNPVSGDNFYGRENEKKRAFNYLENNNSIALFGLRRIGKSSILKEIEREFIKKEYQVIYIDVQNLDKLVDFFREIYKKLPDDFISELINQLKKLPARIMEIINIKEIEIMGSKIKFGLKDDKLIKDYWEEISNIFSNLLIKDKKILLLIDELPFFFENFKENKIEYTKKILTTFKYWRNQGITMAIAGSIQIDNFLKNLSISENLLVGLNRIDIKPFTQDEAIGFMELALKEKSLLIEKKLHIKAIDLILDYIPIMLQIFANEIIFSNPENEEDIINIYEKDVLPKIEKDFFYQFEERLTNICKEIENGKHVSTEIFNYLEKQSDISQGISNEYLRKNITNYNEEVRLRLLYYDFLIRIPNNKVTFSLNCVKYWWLQRKS